MSSDKECATQISTLTSLQQSKSDLLQLCNVRVCLQIVLDTKLFDVNLLKLKQLQNLYRGSCYIVKISSL